MKTTKTVYETGATSHAVNDLILFTDNTPELAALRDSIYSVKINVPTVSFRPLLGRAIELYGKQFGRNSNTRHIRLMSQDERDEYCALYDKDFPTWKAEHGYK